MHREYPSLPATRCGNTVFNWGKRTYVMGIINVSPDSFSGDGLCSFDSAIAQAKRFIDQGADIIDVGGESTRPDSQPVSAEEETARVVPVIEALSREICVPISIDTYKSAVARCAVKAGAGMINDVWGLKKSPELAEIAAEAKIPIIITSNQRDEPCRDIMSAVIFDLEDKIRLAENSGVKPENIIIDPGIGFGKTLEQNLEIVRRLAELKLLGKPILLGTSRKSLIGKVLDLPPEQRLEGTAATVAIGIANGTDIIRVHDVEQMVRVCRMSDAIIRRKE
ncbi:MAG: dihydropteroate synthase [Dehalococcoidales bacterium]|nr:dihydropteroate synthase [Dehalococcoidales bacterium]